MKGRVRPAFYVMCMEARSRLQVGFVSSEAPCSIVIWRRKFGGKWQTARSAEFLRSLPIFKVQPLPRTFVDLLQRLEDEEDKAEGNGGA